MNWLSSPEQTLRLMTAQTPLEAIKTESLSLAQIGSIHNDTAIYILLELIGDLVKYFSVGKTMGAAQVRMTIDLIVPHLELKNLKPEDYKVCFDRMKRGEYGPMYDRLDGAVIIDCLTKYAQERFALITEMNNHEHELRKADKGAMHPRILKALKKIVSSIPKEQPFISKPKPKTIEPSERDMFIQSCFKEFDKLRRTDAIDEHGKFIEYNGKNVNEIEFVQLRVNEFDNERRSS